LGHYKESLPITGLSYSLRHIAHTNNGFFKLAEALLQIHSCFFSHSIKLLPFLLSASGTVSLHYPPKMSEFNSHMRQKAYYRNLK